MTFRKFGTSDEQQVALDREDDQGVQKTATATWTEKDAEALRKESEPNTEK